MLDETFALLLLLSEKVIKYTKTTHHRKPFFVSSELKI